MKIQTADLARMDEMEATADDIVIRHMWVEYENRREAAKRHKWYALVTIVLALYVVIALLARAI